MPTAATLNSVTAPTSAALRTGETGAFDAGAFDLSAFDTEDTQDVAPTTATLNAATAPTSATLQDV